MSKGAKAANMWVTRRLPARKLRQVEGGAKRRCVVPTIEFIANAIGRPKRVEAPDGGDLLDICDEAIAPIPFSCRSATCGTCHVEVLEGADFLEPSSSREAELLDLLGGENTRLACQARVRPGPGLLRLRAVLGG